MPMSHDTYTRKIKPIADRFHQAHDDGKLVFGYVYSPQDTIADTRFRFYDLNGMEHILFVKEADGYIAGMGY